MQDGELVAEGENLKLKGCAAAEGHPEGHEQSCEYMRGRESMEDGQHPFYFINQILISENYR